MVRPDSTHPGHCEPADNRPHRAVRRANALGGVLPLPAFQTLRCSAVRSVPFHRR